MSEQITWLGDVLIIVGMVVFVVAGVIHYILRRVNRRLEEQLAQLTASLESRMVHLNVELDNGMYFCYNKQDNSFVCQGATALEIRQAFDARYPDKIAYLNNQQDVPELVEQILKLKENETSHSQ